MKNLKVKNAEPILYDGIRFKSKLEVYCYKRLKEEGIEFEYEKHSFVLMDKFYFKNSSLEAYKLKNEKFFDYKKPLIRAISYKPDFVNWKEHWVIECKGYPNDAFPNKWKLFKKHINDKGLNLNLYMPRNQKYVEIVIEEIKRKQNRINLLDEETDKRPFEREGHKL